MTLLKTYYHLTKPGIIYGNDITAAGGFFLAAKGHINLLLFIAAILGLSFVIASACVFNNYIDRGIDEKMERTKKRALVTGEILGRNAILYGIILGVIGFGMLLLWTNLLTMFIALIGFLFYVVVYGYFKRNSVHGTVVGSISGAVPPVVGYCAVTNKFDTGALLLFLILIFWQMPHFYAISIYRMKDYANAKIPVLSVKNGIKSTKIQMLLYIIGFIIAAELLTVFHYTGYEYGIIAGILGIGWLSFGLKGFQKYDDNKWARKMFRFSLLVITMFSLIISIDAIFLH